MHTTVQEARTFAQQIHGDATKVGKELSAAYQALLGALPGRPQRPTDIVSALGVTMNLAHRLATALSKHAPLESLLAMPGPLPLNQVIDIAQNKKVSADVCDQAREAVRGFEELIRSVGNDRTSFDALVSEWVPEMRVQINTTARQSIYRGIRQVKGISAEAHFHLFAFYPNSELDDRADFLALEGYRNIERVRMNGSYCLPMEYELRGRCAVGESKTVLLEDFCSTPTPSFQLSKYSTQGMSVLEWNNAIGRDSAQDVVLGTLHRNGYARYARNEERLYGNLIIQQDVPVKKYICDMLFHKTLYENCIPFFHVYEASLQGARDPNDQHHQHARLQVDCEMQSVPQGHVSEIVTPEIPFYQRMLRSQFEALDWNLSEFRAFRVRLEYPIFNSQMQFVIPLPQKPEK